MSNANIKRLTITAVFALASTSTYAADLSVPIMPQPVEVSGWYLRGDIGMTNQNVGQLHQRYEDVISEQFTYTSKSFDSSPFFGIGVGYYFNDWLRFDVTGEYRGRANLHATAFGNAGSIDNYQGSKSEFTGLLNAYVDLGTWRRVTPFVGAGVGFSYNRIHDFYDTCASGQCAGVITGVADGTGTKWNLAWALYAGLGYQVTPGFTVELAYRYINLGDAQSGWFHNVDPALSVAPGPYEFKGITSQDVKIGVRWMFGAPEMPVYAPPPPLNSRG